MKTFGKIKHFVVFFLLISLLAMPVYGQTDPIETQSMPQDDASFFGCYSVDATEAFLGDTRLVKNATSVFLYEMNTHTLMYAMEPDLAQNPTSFVKLLTAIVAIENASLDSAVTVPAHVLEAMPAGAVSAKLVADEVLTLKDLLYCMLVGSANDAASVIAEYVGGSQAGFADMMNALASSIGCTGSHFVNPHGLHADGQVTTARDTAKILEYAMKNDEFRAAFTAVEYTVPVTNKSSERYLLTGNYMMTNSDQVQIYLDERVIGGRTGIANDGTRCLATVAKQGSLELLCVVMGAASVYEEGGSRIRSYGGYNETKTLLDAGFNGNTASQILYDGQALIQLAVDNGDTILTVGPRSNLSTVLPETLKLEDLTFRYSNEDLRLQAPINSGDRICNVEIWYEDLCLAVTDLYAMNNVRASSVVQPDIQSDSGWIAWVVVPGVILLLLALWVWLRTSSGRRVLARLLGTSRKKKRTRRRV